MKVHLSTLLAACAAIALFAAQGGGGSAASPAPPSAAAKNSPPAKGTAAPKSPQSNAAPAKSSAQFGDATMETDEIDANNKDGDFTMPHKVTMVRPGSDAVGDRAQGNFKKKLVTLTGDVVVHQTKPNGGIGKLGEKPSTLTTNELTVDWGNKIYTAVGSVRFVQGERTMTADRGVLNEITHDLDLNGNVHVEETDRSANAETVHYNTQSEDVKMQGNVMLRFPSETATPAGPPATTTAPPPKKKRRL